MKALTRIVYAPELEPLRRLARRTGFRGILAEWYYRRSAPEGVVELDIAHERARFHAHTHGELRLLESHGQRDPTGYAETHFLELLMRALEPGDVVYDIGANVGLYTVFLAKAVGPHGRVIAFEPESQTYPRLLENLQLNGLSNVSSFRLALGATASRGRLCCGEVTGNFSLVGHSGSVLRSEWVEIVQGDRLVQAEHLPLPRVVKIDVEGFEYAVLCGLRQTLAQPVCRLAICEIHPQLLPPGVKPEAVLGLLKSLGFSRIDLYPRRTELHAVARRVEGPRTIGPDEPSRVVKGQA